MARRLVLALALALHFATGLLYAAAGLIAPTWAVLLLWGAWVVLLWLLVRLWRRRPVLALLVPPAAIGLFVGVLGAGGAVLGWTA